MVLIGGIPIYPISRYTHVDVVASLADLVKCFSPVSTS